MKTKKQDQLIEYRKRRDAFLAKHRNCARCGKQKTVDLHHCFGRQGALLIEERLFAPLCRECHHWCHNRIKEAREIKWRGVPLIAPQGFWNATPVRIYEAKIVDEGAG